MPAYINIFGQIMKYRFLLTIIVLSLITPFTCAYAQSNAEEYKKLIGRWVRSEGGYILVIKNVRFDGSIEAEYLNPKPINVSKARVSTESAMINIFVELKDRYYPGNYYELYYDKGADKLIGTYYHLGINQKFEVFFLKEKNK
jgi:hypothetical protein